MVVLRHGGRRIRQLNPPRRGPVVLPGLVIALAGGWLLVESVGAGPVPVESPLARCNGLVCGAVLMITGASGRLWSRNAVGVAVGVGAWLLLAPALLQYDQAQEFRSAGTQVATSVGVMLAAERWASGVAGRSGPVRDHE